MLSIQAAQNSHARYSHSLGKGAPMEDFADTESPFTALRACIFDFDGVIIDSEPIHAEAKRITLEHFQIVYPATIFDDLKGRPDQAFFAYVVDQLDTKAITANELEIYKRDLYLHLFDQVTFVQGAAEFIALAANRFNQLGLATSATRRDFALAAEKYQLWPWFPVIVTGEDTVHHKPDPEPYLTAMAALGVTGAETLVIEDSPNGIRSGKAARCTVAAITTTFPADELQMAGADLIVASFGELAQALGM